MSPFMENPFRRASRISATNIKTIVSATSQNCPLVGCQEALVFTLYFVTREI